MPFKDPEVYKAYQLAYHKKRYATDPEFRKRCLETSSAYNKERYASDPEYRNRVKVLAKEWVKQNKPKRRLIEYRYWKRDPLRHKAKQAVAQKVYRNQWPAASELLCSICGKQADHYHHNCGYEQQHWYDVIPICRACHKDLHA